MANKKQFEQWADEIDSISSKIQTFIEEGNDKDEQFENTPEGEQAGEAVSYLALAMEQLR